MPTHRCLDPQDPYAEREVCVAFAWVADHPRLIAALNEHGVDILPDLVEAQCDDLRREIVATLLVQGPAHLRPAQGSMARIAAR